MKPFFTSNMMASLAMLCVPTLPTLACLWDSDTLRSEAKGLPGIAEIITGRFERNPPLYYEMRLERSGKAIELNPHDWEAYDDAGVACDRLGRDDEAIQWMKHKKAAMDSVGSDDNTLTDHRYRYLANLGTFHVHRWFGHGARRTDMTDVQLGIEFIEAAITLKPDAHFGRERYQLMAMRWILNPPSADIDKRDGMLELPVLFLADERFEKLMNEGGHRTRGNLKDAGLDDAVQGLSGLIALGSAWESVDVFFALAFALNDNVDSAMAHLAMLRCIELIRSGKKSLHPDAPVGEELIKLIQLHGFQSTEEPDVDAYFPMARKANERWHDNRTKFMLTQLEVDKHPDSDGSFWTGYVEIPPIALPNGLLGFGRGQVSTIVNVGIVAASGLVIGIGVIWLMRRSRRARVIQAIVDP